MVLGSSVFLIALVTIIDSMQLSIKHISQHFYFMIFNSLLDFIPNHFIRKQGSSFIAIAVDRLKSNPLETTKQLLDDLKLLDIIQ